MKTLACGQCGLRFNGSGIDGIYANSLWAMKDGPCPRCGNRGSLVHMSREQQAEVWSRFQLTPTAEEAK